MNTRMSARSSRPFRLISTAAALLGVGTAGGAIAARSAEAVSGNQPDLDKKTITAMFDQVGGPVAEHANLEPLVGDSDMEVRITMMPGTPPMIARAVGQARWVLGGRFIELRSTPAPGEELGISSIGYMGYDKRQGKYFWWAIDSTDTYSVFAQGNYDPDSRTFTLLGENQEPGIGMVPFKIIIRQDNDTRGTTQVWFKRLDAPNADAEGWAMMVEMISTRK
ncbi:MAG: DUF1579 family protein [Phycisphaeraceae bacterium]|nr:DUF1579 family protein [Phycisphaerae bacterium]MBX3393312.1 DUF1579 family protein [Phycisphaeraceae bacterium]